RFNRSGGLMATGESPSAKNADASQSVEKQRAATAALCGCAECGVKGLLWQLTTLSVQSGTNFQPPFNGRIARRVRDAEVRITDAEDVSRNNQQFLGNRSSHELAACFRCPAV